MSKLLTSWQRAGVLEAVFDQLSDGVILYDRDLIVTGVNRAAEHMLGMSAEDMIGRDCKEVFRCGVCDPGCGMLVGLNRAPTVPSCRVRLHTASGQERIVTMRTAHIRSETGEIEGVAATLQAVTDAVAPPEREMLAEAPAMRELLHFVRRIAATEASTILIEGESGTGKDLIAKVLHYQSMRQAEPFIAINCAAIPETLLESELFGYEKGAFTDARAQKRGILELADRGTVFLDEIGELPMLLQVKLLRVLEEQSFRRLGGLRDIQVNLRVIAATNRNLREAVKEGAFRQDLYYRLNVIQIMIPPLRERREDILPLVEHFILHYNRKFKRNVDGVSPEVARLMMNHDWPGNVRELRNAVERAMILEETSLLQPSSLPIGVGAGESAGHTERGPAADMSTEGLSLEEAEKAMLVRALEKTGGNQTQAARLLSITRDTLRYKMKKFSLR